MLAVYGWVCDACQQQMPDAECVQVEVRDVNFVSTLDTKVLDSEAEHSEESSPLYKRMFSATPTPTSFSPSKGEREVDESYDFENPEEPRRATSASAQNRNMTRRGASKTR